MSNARAVGGTCICGKAEKSLFHSRAQRSLTMFREELESRQGSVLCAFARGSTRLHTCCLLIEKATKLLVRRKRDGEGEAVGETETKQDGSEKPRWG